MNQNNGLIFSKNIRILIKFQCRKMCKKKPLKDMIGPPNEISNLRPIKYAVQENETPLEKELRKQREDLQKWNEEFWTKHNYNYIQRKREFEQNALNKKGENNQTLGADEMSVFYKEFLDTNWKKHLNYLFEWYRRHVYITLLHLRINFEKIYKKR